MSTDQPCRGGGVQVDAKHQEVTTFSCRPGRDPPRTEPPKDDSTNSKRKRKKEEKGKSRKEEKSSCS